MPGMFLLHIESMMTVRYFGHSCFTVEAGGKSLLFDPYISPNDLAKSIEVDDLCPDFILISHGHGDHMADAVRIAKNSGATVICNYEISEWLGRQGLTKVHGVNHGGWSPWAFGRLQFVQAVHSSMLPDGSYGGNPGGFVIESSSGNFYYSGDTALTLDMKLIGESISLDFAVLCIGDYFTMGVKDAIRAADFIQCPNIMGVHYNTFPPIRIHTEQAVAAFKNAGKTLHLLEIGESRSI